MNKTLTGLASAFALCTSITAAQANPVDVVVDDNLHQKLFRISENWNIPGTSTITRGMLDEAANVYCEWTSSADIDANNKISNVHEISRSCKEAEPSDTAPFSGGKETDFSTAFSNYQHFIAPGMNTNTVIDGVTTGPNNADITSEFRRTWDFNTGTVCLHAEESQASAAPYISVNMGCFPIPNNQHVDAIKATLTP